MNYLSTSSCVINTITFVDIGLHAKWGGLSKARSYYEMGDFLCICHLPNEDITCYWLAYCFPYF
jgi:hypothetical protein